MTNTRHYGDRGHVATFGSVANGTSVLLSPSISIINTIAYPRRLMRLTPVLIVERKQRGEGLEKRTSHTGQGQ